ncbi:MAG: triose-phosphate isomerase [Rhodobacteraceae bacterium]|nr:triose-phosphate isomerase [Paracoccaceae bacterium]
MPRKIAAGNWKMNGTSSDLVELDKLAAAHADPSVVMLICPPATLIERADRICAAAGIAVGGQDCHAAASGAHTGDTSAQMLWDAGAAYVILGHSERRADHGETDADVSAKIAAAQAVGLTAILCVGESLAQRDAGQALAVVGAQLRGSLPDGVAADRLIVAYEPVWAIGTGKVPTLEQIGEVHGFLRASLADLVAEGAADVPLLYGGSVKAANAADIFGVADVDGALVGGASLTAADFSPIVTALQNA